MFPTYHQVERPLLAELRRRGGSARPADRDSSGRSVYDALADHFKLSEADRLSVIYEKGIPRSKWENMVRYAVRRLKDQGLMVRGAHGVGEVTDKLPKRAYRKQLRGIGHAVSRHR